MKKLKKTSSKTLAVLLSFLIIVSIIPIQTLATETLNNEASSEVATDTYKNARIIKEIVEERSENSKTFLMTDGTYYTYIYHQFPFMN